jgi:hypothetical protein
VDFEEEGNVRRRMLLRSLFSWWIFKRRVVWGGDFEEWTCGGECCWGDCLVDEHVKENAVVELVQLMDFEERVVWGGDFGEWTCGGECCWGACLVDGFWRGGVVWGDFREWTCGGECCWGACSVSRFWRGGVVWGDFEEWPCGGEWCSRGCVDVRFLGGGGVSGWFSYGGVNVAVLRMVFWEVGVPSSSLLFGKIISEERVFIIICLRGHMMKFTLASFSFSIPSSSSG